MLQFYVNLYNSVYWTKRAFVILGLILFLCMSFRIFSFLSKKFTTKDIIGNTEPKAELGFGKIDRLTLTPLDVPQGFKPTQFINNIIDGSLSAANGYPTDKNITPVANVFKINDPQIDIGSTTVPNEIAKNFSFKANELIPSSLPNVQIWKTSTRELEINGQYLLIKYKNNSLTTKLPTDEKSNPQPLSFSSKESMLAYFNKVLKDIGVTSDFTSYDFNYEPVIYDAKAKEFISTGSTVGDFIRINAVRTYPQLSKVSSKSAANAAYPNYTYSNNYIIVPRVVSFDAKPAEYISELSLYNWGIGSDNKDELKSVVQTYNIKTPKQAFNELTKNNQYLVSATKWNTKVQINPNDLVGVSRVLVNRIRMDFYEDTVYTNYIQPIYVFICEANKGNEKYELVYYIPAVTDVNE